MNHVKSDCYETGCDSGFTRQRISAWVTGSSAARVSAPAYHRSFQSASKYGLTGMTYRTPGYIAQIKDFMEDVIHGYYTFVGMNKDECHALLSKCNNSGIHQEEDKRYHATSDNDSTRRIAVEI